MYARVDLVNETEGHRLGEPEVYETSTDNLNRLFRAYQKEYGACKSKVYIDGPKGEAVPVGWYFEKRAQYTDSTKTYLQGAWIELHVTAPTVLNVRREYLCNLDTGRAHRQTFRRISRAA